MGRIASIFVSTLAVIGTATAASSVLDLTSSNFDSVVLTGKPALVEFFAPWCGHCKKLAPIYEELGTNWGWAKEKLSIAKVDADEERSMGSRFGIQGFPTIQWFDGKSEEGEVYTGARDLESLTEFVAQKSGLSPRSKKAAPSAVHMLTDDDFSTMIGGDRDALVAFTAPWCGHCKTLAPIWEQVAADFESEPSVLIGKVDCEGANSKATAQAEGVRSYPTIKYFAKGSNVGVPYEGGRTEAEILEFVNKNAGTHRAIGGGLDSLAGTIPSLDELVSALKSGGASAYEALEAAAGQAKETYAEYYAKVAKKVEANAGYVEKELARVQGLLAKGGLAKEKQDDLISRSNILTKFLGGKDAKDEL